MMTLGLGERQGRSGWQGGGAGGKQPSLLLEASLLLDLVACRTRCLGFRRGVSVVLPVTGSADAEDRDCNQVVFRKKVVGDRGCWN